MALITCPECGAGISGQAAACPHCGHPTTSSGPATRQIGEWTQHLKMACPHCGTVGQVRTRPVKKKTGISGGKATAAVFTLGWSMLATGLSRKEQTTEAVCQNCKAAWTIR